MSGIFDIKFNIGYTDKTEIGQNLFSQIVNDVIADAQRNDRILVAYTISENIAHEVIEKQRLKYFCQIVFTSLHEHQIQFDKFGLNIHFVNIGAIGMDDLQHMMRGRLFDKIVIVDGSWTTEETKNVLRNRMHSANGKDREAFTIFTSGIGYKDENLDILVNYSDVMRLPNRVNVFLYKEREAEK